jgi:hypothetical protein
MMTQMTSDGSVASTTSAAMVPPIHGPSIGTSSVTPAMNARPTASGASRMSRPDQRQYAYEKPHGQLRLEIPAEDVRDDGSHFLQVPGGMDGSQANMRSLRYSWSFRM